MAALAGVLGVPIPVARLALDATGRTSKGSGRKSARCSTSVRRPLPTPRLSARGFATTLSRSLATTIG
jgi:hypothetical protein